LNELIHGNTKTQKTCKEIAQIVTKQADHKKPKQIIKTKKNYQNQTKNKRKQKLRKTKQSNSHNFSVFPHFFRKTAIAFVKKYHFLTILSFCKN